MIARTTSSSVFVSSELVASSRTSTSGLELQGSRDSEPLLLSSGECDAALTDPVVDAALTGCDQGAQLRLLEDLNDLLSVIVLIPGERNVLSDSSVEQGYRCGT